MNATPNERRFREVVFSFNETPERQRFEPLRLTVCLKSVAKRTRLEITSGSPTIRHGTDRCWRAHCRNRFWRDPESR